MGHEKEEDVECQDKRWNDSYGASEITRKSHIPKHRSYKSIGSDQKPIYRGIRIKTSSDSQSKGFTPPTRGVTVDGVANSSKEYLLDAVQNHFMSQQVEEVEVIVEFAHAAKRLKSHHNYP